MKYRMHSKPIILPTVLLPTGLAQISDCSKKNTIFSYLLFQTSIAGGASLAVRVEGSGGTLGSDNVDTKCNDNMKSKLLNIVFSCSFIND